jgi:hypothetical protein
MHVLEPLGGSGQVVALAGSRHLDVRASKLVPVILPRAVVVAQVGVR